MGRERHLLTDPFNDGIARRLTGEKIRDDYSRMSARLNRERREANNDSWIRTGDKNIVRKDYPRVPRIK